MMAPLNRFINITWLILFFIISLHWIQLSFDSATDALVIFLVCFRILLALRQITLFGSFQRLHHACLLFPLLSGLLDIFLHDCVDLFKLLFCVPGEEWILKGERIYDLKVIKHCLSCGSKLICLHAEGAVFEWKELILLREKLRNNSEHWVFFIIWFRHPVALFFVVWAAIHEASMCLEMAMDITKYINISLFFD